MTLNIHINIDDCESSLLKWFRQDFSGLDGNEFENFRTWTEAQMVG